jgi:hypothetical protein
MEQAHVELVHVEEQVREDVDLRSPFDQHNVVQMMAECDINTLTARSAKYKVLTIVLYVEDVY